MDRTRFADLATSLAWQLGELRSETWTVAQELHDEQANGLTVLAGGIARLRLTWNHRDARLTVAGLGPDGRQLGRWRVTVDPQRGLLIIGRDIDRRLISAGYADDLLVARAKKDELKGEES